MIEQSKAISEALSFPEAGFEAESYRISARKLPSSNTGENAPAGRFRADREVTSKELCYGHSTRPKTPL